jgi:outer membrane protein assembly factor BamB
LSSLSRLAIIAIVVLLLSGALPASSGAEDGDGSAVAVLFDFGTGRWAWSDVALPDPANAWCATVSAAEELGFDLDYSFSQFGVFLEGVDGVDTPEDFSKYWGLWSWDGSAWESTMVGATDMAVENGTVIAWQFTAFGVPAPASTPNTRDPWTGFRGGHELNGLAGPELPAAGGVFWSIDMDNGPIDSTLAVADGKVFGITAGIFNWSAFEFLSVPYIFALDAVTGELVWKREFQGQGGFEIGSPAYAGGTLYVTISARKVLALDALDGDLLWQTDVDDLGLSASPTVAGDKVLVGTGSGNLVALSTSNGDIQWTANLSGWVYLAAPTVHDDIVYIGTDNGTLHAFHIGNGTEVWTTDLPGRIRGTPLVAADRIYAISAIYPGFVATEGFLHSLDMDGNVLWNVSIGPTGSSPFRMGDWIVVGSRSGLWAIEYYEPTVVWRVQDFGQVSASPVGNDFGVLFTSNENDTDKDLHTSVIALDHRGDLLWSKELRPHNWALSSVSLADGIAYTATDAGWVYALGDTPIRSDFDYRVDSGVVALSANSTAVGSNVTRYLWYIEELDVQLEGRNVTYEFEDYGLYNVTLTIVDEFGRESAVSYPVDVEQWELDEFYIPRNVSIAFFAIGMLIMVVAIWYNLKRRD